MKTSHKKTSHKTSHILNPELLELLVETCLRPIDSCGIACVSDELKAHGYRSGRHTMDSRDVLNLMLSMSRKFQTPLPNLLDVLHCVVMDSECLNYPTFEEWAETLGFNPDSRKDEQTYNACVSQSLRLLQLFGAQGLEKLRELFQDY